MIRERPSGIAGALDDVFDDEAVQSPLDRQLERRFRERVRGRFLLDLAQIGFVHG